MEKLVEIARSFSYKYNAGNYQSQDFFCSQKAECKESEAEEVSQRLYHFCKQQVIKDLNAWIAENNKTPEEKYIESGQPPKHFEPKPGEIEKLKEFKATYKEEPQYEATDRVGGKKKINKEENTLIPK